MNAFRQRSASALTHPVTLAALALLLLNDIVFKSMWPGSWATGKLSDLAWVVFASPLLAFLISLLVGNRRVWQQPATILSYVGLPILYAAFNSFEPVHHWILQGLSTVSGGIAGSPLDPTDSIVIPLGWASAVWVWRRQPASTQGLRLRLTILVAAIACFASIATSEPQRVYGIRNLTVSSDNVVYARNYTNYQSNDGGITWKEAATQAPAGESGDVDIAETPDGIYTIDGADIVFKGPENERAIVWSSSYLKNDANKWVQRHSDERFTVLTAEPYSIVYERVSGNVIVALGLQGVVVGTPDGQWRHVAVGPYEPTDLSFGSKTLLLFSNFSFIALISLMPLPVVGCSLFVSQYAKKDIPLLILAGVVATPVVLGLAAATPFLLPFTGGFIIFAPVGIALAASFMPKESVLRKGLGVTFCALSLLVCLLFVLSFGVVDEEPHNFEDLGRIAFLLGTAVLGLSVLLLGRQQLAENSRVAAIGFLGMSLLVVLTFLAWLHTGISLPFAQVASVVLLILAGVALTAYLKIQSQSDGQKTKIK